MNSVKLGLLIPVSALWCLDATAAPVITLITLGGEITEGAAVEFTCTADSGGSSAAAFSWTFGDGETAFGPIASHAYVDDGNYEVTCNVEDSEGVTVSETLPVHILNASPEMSGLPPETIVEGVEYHFDPTVADLGEEDVHTWSAGLPSGGFVDFNTGSVTWRPGWRDDGPFSMHVEVSDGDGGIDHMTWSVEVEILDEDGDGVSDLWENEFGMDPTDPTDAMADVDGDGRTAFDEYTYNTDPLVDDSPGLPTVLFPLDGVEVAAESMEFTVTNQGTPEPELLMTSFELYADEAMTELLDSAEFLPMEDDGTVIWSTESILEENTHYYWTAVANDGFTSGDWMPTQTFFYNRNNDRPSAPSPALPLDGGTVANSQVVLTVDASVDGDEDALTYGFILTDINGEFVRSMEGIMETYPTVRWASEVVLADEETYCWTSFAVDEHGSESESSVEACFTVDQDNMAPTQPVIKQPSPGEVFATDTVVMQVSNCTDPEGRSTMYRLELDTEPNFSSDDFEGVNRTALVGSDMNLILEGLEDDTTYYARVLCSDGAASSDWVQTNFFVDLDNEAPSVPKLHNPPADTAMSAGDELGVVNAIDPEDDNVMYDFAIYNANEEVVAQAFNVKESETGYSRWQPPALDGGQYTWTARAVDELGMESGWSDRRAVVVANAPAEEEFEFEVPKSQVVAQPDATIGAPSATTGCSYLERRGGLGWLVLTIGGLVLGGRRRR